MFAVEQTGALEVSILKLLQKKKCGETTLTIKL
jgi:hypothetical protein